MSLNSSCSFRIARDAARSLSALSRSPSNQQIILISLEQTPTRLIPAHHRSSPSVDYIDAVSTPPFASTSAIPLAEGLVDLYADDGPQRLVNAVLDVLKRRKSEGKKVTVVLDSADALAEKGVHAVFSLVKKILRTLEGGAPGGISHSD